MPASEVIDIELEATIVADRNSGWASVIVPQSAAKLGTGRAVKVAGTVDGHGFQATLLPIGSGEHMLPIKAALRSAIGKGVGDNVVVHLDRRMP